jgi:nitroreductase
MTFQQLAEERYSLRQFRETPVEKEKIDLILKAAQRAPTACNNQPQRILVLESPEAILKLRQCTPCHFGAPMAFLICYDSALSWKRPFDGKDSGEVDAAIVCTQMMLQAQELGLGTTWVGYFDPEATVKEFALPAHIVPVAFLPTGYPAQDAAPADLHYSRKPLSETVSYNGF